MSANDIVISGMSGRFPESRNLEEFSKNLYSGVDMVTESEDRWPGDIYGMANRMGRIPDFDQFDGTFFGIMGQMVEVMDPQARLLLEATYEAIVDAGINPQSIRGTRTGVYVGISHYALTEGYPEYIPPDMGSKKANVMLGVMGNFKCLYANRISFAFDFKGPSLVTDTACSASLTAFNVAMNDLLLGRIDYAIVGGTHMTLQPFLVHMQQEAGVCSHRGVSAVLDESADGFVKSDATCCVFLQKASTAKRVYAKVLSSRVNVDGKKTVGMFFPSSEAQEELMVMAYKEAGIDPLKLTYIEGHFTATKVGDPQELKAIYNAYVALPGRVDTLPLGLLKSNIGHTEGASGIAALIKVLLSYENESIPPNINLKQIKHECKQYIPPLYPNTEILKYNPGMAAINNFGIGGVNGNVLIEPNYKLTNEDNLRIAENIPRIVNICGRTEEAVRHIFDFIENNPQKISRDFLALLTDTMKYVTNVNSPGFPFRGSIVMKKVSEDESGIQYEYKKQMSEMKSKTLKPIWFLFPGLGGQWTAMAKALMPIKIFADKVEECHQILLEFKMDLKNLLLSEDKTVISTMTAKFCATTAIEIALFEVLKALDITPDGIIGHSFGEIACAYADGCINTKEAMIVTHLRGVITEGDRNIERGSMILCALSKAEAKKLIPPEVVIACNNAKNTVVLSGPIKQINEIIKNLKEKNIFVYELESSGIPYHSKYLMSSAKPMTQQISQYLSKPMKRSKKWISTSILESEPKEEILKYASAEYFVNNLISPVYFYDKLKELPSDAIVIEIGPHGVFRKIINETLEMASYLTLIKKDSNDTNLDNFLSAIATLYEWGLNPSIENLYPKVEFPVSRNTPTIGALIKWDHSVQYYYRKYPEIYNRSTASDMNFTINMITNDENFYAGHCIDGNILFPATGYLMLAWRQFSAYLGKTWENVPVVFENVQFKRAVFLTHENKTKLIVRYDRHSGSFYILDNENVCASGKVSSPTEDSLLVQSIIHEKQNIVLENEFNLSADDIYKDLRVMGYDYSGEFQRLKNIRTNDFKEIHGICEWNGNVIPYLDALLQSMIFATPFRKLMVPVMIKTVRIDPKVLFESIKHYRYDDQLGKASCEEELKNFKAESFIEIADSALEKMKSKYCVFSSSIPFYFNSKSKLLVTHGIEINDVTILPIPRKVDMANLVLDSYEFVANEDNNAIESCDRSHIIEYLEVCKSMAAKLKQIGFKDIKCDFNYQNISTEQMEAYRHYNKETHVLFNILYELNTTAIDENQNFAPDKLKAYINDIQSKSINLQKDLVNDITLNEKLIRSLTDIVSENNILKRELKVTEINLSSNILGKEVEQNMSFFSILPTNIDYELILKSTENIIDFNAKPKIWDIKDEIQIKSSDLIIFRDTQELWELSLESLIKQFKASINGNGFLLTVARFQLTEPELALNSVFNKTKIIDNSDLEKRILEIIETAEKSGLYLICSKSDSIATKALLFRKIEEKNKIPENNQIIEITAERNENWFEFIKEKLIEAKDSDNKSDNVWLIARDNNINGIIGLINCLRLEPGGENMRCIYDYDHSIKLPIDWNSKPFSDILRNDLVINVIRDAKLGTYRHLRLPKDYDKTLSNEYFLNLGQNKDLSSLQWFDARNIVANNEFYDLMGNKTNQVPVSVYSCALNFRDIMLATGRVPSGQMALFTDCLLGYEFAGRRADTGERIMGMEATRCFTTSIHANEKTISPIPEHWTMNEATTVMTTYSTAWYGLIERAGLQKGESVLIHSGAGGVGQSAINICKHYECDIFVTVGTEEKKRFLINEYNIPENRIFSSRDIQFKYKIKEITEGKGVDIVLNSLSGEKLEASYDCVADSGRFVEMGKFDLAQNKQMGMFDFLRDICFIGVAVDVCLMKDPTFANRFFDWMHKNCRNGCVKPLNTTVFKSSEAVKAFRYMTTGKHIGKIVLKMRDEENNKNPIKSISPAEQMITITKTYFNPNKVYIITGGLGGFGIELVHWMMYMGARKFVLTSRSGLKTDYQKYVINRLILFGENHKYFNVKIHISKNDCLTVESTRRVISDASEFGQIGGIFHLSIVLNDCLVEKLSFEKFCESIDTKYKVFNHLDVESRKLSYNLDYFVVFSSVTCGKGNNGQTNYSFGNSLCERICEQRRKEGLHGLAIQYGPVGDVGVFEKTSDNTLLLTTLQKQRINSCCDVLDKLLAVKQPIVTSFLKAERTVQSGSKQKRMIKELWKALGIDPETTPPHLTLGEIGLESMFAVELQQELEREYNVKISLNHIKTISVGMLKDYEMGKLEHVKNFLDELKKAREMLFSYKFIIPNETHTKLNEVNSGKPIYFLPPIEITFSVYEELAKKFDRPVIGLNWTKHMNKFETIKELTEYYSEVLNKLEPNGKYDLVGYLDGALVISKLLLKGRVNKGVIVDVVNDKRFKEKCLSDEFLIQFLFGFLSKQLPATLRDKIYRELNSESDFDAKVRRIVNELKDLAGRALISVDLEEIFHLIAKRAKMTCDYRNQKKNKFSDKLKERIGKKWAKKSGKLVIIKGFKFSEVDDVDEEVEDTRDIYLLPQQEDSKETIAIEGIDSENAFEVTSELIGDKIIEAFK